MWVEDTSLRLSNFDQEELGFISLRGFPVSRVCGHVLIASHCW